MSLYFYSTFYFLFACYFDFVLPVPPDSCFAQFNGSDCGRDPTPVFSYYKPGSRCEIKMWRGCPTRNIFPNEYVCSFNCMFRPRYNEPQTTTPAPEDCDAILNPNQCANETVKVYTHVYQRCIEAQWWGCKTQNKFKTKEACIKACNATEEIVIEEELQDLNEDTLKDLNEILDEVIEEVVTTTEAPTTEKEETEEETEAPETEAPETEAPETEHEESEEHPVTSAEEEEHETTTEPIETTTNDDYDEIITP